MIELKKIANASYDTDSQRADDEVYKSLPEYCQIKRPEWLNQKNI